MGTTDTKDTDGTLTYAEGVELNRRVVNHLGGRGVNVHEMQFLVHRFSREIIGERKGKVDQPNFIELAMEEAARAMATIHEGSVFAGHHHEGRYYFILTTSDQLYVVRYRGQTPVKADNALLTSDQLEGDTGFGQFPYSSTTGEALAVTPTAGMPAPVVVALLRSGRHGQ